MSGHVDIAVTVTVAIFMAGVIFAGGRISARVEGLEQWRKELLDELHAWRTETSNGLANLERLIKNRNA